MHPHPHPLCRWSALLHLLLMALGCAFPGLAWTAVPLSPGFVADDVPQYGLFEFVVGNPHAASYANPFDYTEIELAATFTAPDGRRLTSYGFHDGDGAGGQSGSIWRFRFMPDQVGAWTYTYSWTGSSSSKPADGSGSFTCIGSTLPGPLRIAQPKGWHLENARGEPFHIRPYGLQWIGEHYDADGNRWPWQPGESWENGDVSAWTIELIEGIVKPGGWNTINTPTAFNTADGRSSWWVDNDKSLNRFNLGVYRDFDRILRYLNDERIYGFPFAFFGPEKGSAAPQLGRYTAARFWAHYTFFGWCPSWESGAGSHYGACMEQVAAIIPYPALIATHTEGQANAPDWLNTYLSQIKRNIPGEAMNLHIGKRDAYGKTWLVIGHEDAWHFVNTSSTEVVVSRAWVDFIAGVPLMPTDLSANAKSNGAWGNAPSTPLVARMFDWGHSRTNYRHVDWRPRLAKTGADDLEIVTGGIPDEEYLTFASRAYLSANGGQITIDLRDDAGSFAVSWVDPLSGEVVDAGDTVAGGGSRRLTPPFSNVPVVLFLKKGVSNDSTPPSAPGNLQVQAPFHDRVDLGWTAASDAESGISDYQIRRDGVLLATVLGTSYRDSTVSAETSYSYTVTARNGAGLPGPTAGPVGITTPGVDLPPTVSISQPAADAVLAPDAGILISGSAADGDGSVVSLTLTITDLLRQRQAHAETISNPGATWASTWTDPAIGSYRLTVSATDNGGKRTSTSLDLQVQPALSVAIVADTGNDAHAASAAFSASVGGGGAAAPPPDLAWWRGDEGGGTLALDSSGNERHASLTGGAWADGVFDQAWIFDGAGGERLEVADADTWLAGRTSLSLCLWVQGSRNDRGLLSGHEPDGSDRSLGLRFDPWGDLGGASNIISVSLPTSAGRLRLESAANAQSTDWLHIALVWTSAEGLTLFIDGQASMPSHVDGSLGGSLSAIDTLLIGQGPLDQSATWQGFIDDVRIYGRALNAAEVASVLSGSTATPSHAWSISGRPAGTDPVLSPVNAADTVLTLDAAGTYGLQLDLDLKGQNARAQTSHSVLQQATGLQITP